MQRVRQEHHTGCGFACIAMLARQSYRSVMKRAEKLDALGPVGPHTAEGCLRPGEGAERQGAGGRILDAPGGGQGNLDVAGARLRLEDEGRPLRLHLSRVGAFRGEEIATWARCHLQPGTVVVSDALGCFSAVKLAGCFHLPFVTGSGPASAQHPALTWVNTILANSKRSFYGTYHHLSSKHLPRYLAEFSYRFSHRLSLREMFPRLAFASVRTSPVPYRVLKLAETYA